LWKTSLDKETLYENAIQLKKLTNSLREENEYLRARLNQVEEECSKNNKLMQTISSKINTTNDLITVSQTCKRNSLIIALKKKVNEVRQENMQLREEIQKLHHSIKATKQNETETMIIMLEQECTRLRAMLKLMIVNKHPETTEEYNELEAKLLEQFVIVEELRRNVAELKYEANKAHEAEKHSLEQLKALEEKEARRLRKRGTGSKRAEELEEAKGRIARLLYEKNELKRKMEEIKKDKGDMKNNENIIETINNLNKEIKQLREENEGLRKDKKGCERKLIEKDKAIRDATENAKVQENIYILKSLEEKDRLSQKIVRLELELAAKNKDNPSQPIISEVYKSPPKTFPRPLIDPNELLYAVEWIKVRLIKLKKTWEEVKEDLFIQYKAEETISIKELNKIFQKSPLNLSSKDSEMLARYLIEPRDQKEVNYNVYSDKLIASVRSLLDFVLKMDYPNDFTMNVKEVTETVLEKIEKSFKYVKSAVEDVVSSDGKLDFVDWVPICKHYYPELNSFESDCLVVLMVDENNNLRRMEFAVCLV